MGPISLKYNVPIYARLGQKLVMFGVYQNPLSIIWSTDHLMFDSVQCFPYLKLLSGYHADTPITIKAEASRKADSRIH